MITITTDNYRDQNISITLNGQPVVIRLRNDASRSAWYMSVKDDGGSDIFVNRHIKSGVPVNQFVHSDSFVGYFMAVSNESPETSLGNEPWGNTHSLIYFTGDDL